MLADLLLAAGALALGVLLGWWLHVRLDAAAARVADALDALYGREDRAHG